MGNKRFTGTDEPCYEHDKFKSKMENVHKKFDKLADKIEKARYHHREAYCIMTYKCKDCGWTERLWNSRDGVTPFGINCPSCLKSNMIHEKWDQDIRDINHIPKSHERIFIDMPEEVHRIYMIKKVKRFWDHKEFPMRSMFASKEEAIKSLIETYSPGEPFIITWNGQ